MKKTKFLTSFICPHCKEKQEIVGESQTVSAIYELDLESNNWKRQEDEGGDHESWFCRGCGKDLPNKLIKELKLFER